MADPQTVNDIRFVAAELERFRLLSWPELVAYVRAHDDSMIHRLEYDESLLFVGREAYERFWTIAERELNQIGDDHSDFDVDTVAAALREHFVQLLVRHGRELEDASIEELVSSAFATARLTHAVLTHHIPCVITHDQRPDAFVVGPVTFRPAEKFLTQHLDAIERYVSGEFHDSRRPSGEQAVREMLAANAREFYGRFSWVASVAVASSDPAISSARAGHVVDAALDVLRLFFPEPYAANLRRARSSAHVRKAATIITDEHGDIEITTTYTSDKAPAWLEPVLAEYGNHIADAGEWLVAHVQRGTTFDLQRRFLDALHWYGQAIRDETPAGRLVKLTAVLERLTIAKERSGGLTSVVVKRAGLLAKGYRDYTVRDARKAAFECYEWRSRLMHGSHSPYDPRVRTAAADATALVRWCVVEALFLYRYLHNHGLNTDAELEGAYDRWATAMASRAG